MAISVIRISMMCVLFYASSEWESGYPAATGIGTQHGGVLIDFNAVSGEVDIAPLDNDWQRAAHVYSDEVLISHRQIGRKEHLNLKEESHCPTVGRR